MWLWGSVKSLRAGAVLLSCWPSEASSALACHKDVFCFSMFFLKKTEDLAVFSERQNLWSLVVDGLFNLWGHFGYKTEAKVAKTICFDGFSFLPCGPLLPSIRFPRYWPTFRFLRTVGRPLFQRLGILARMCARCRSCPLQLSSRASRRRWREMVLDSRPWKPVSWGWCSGRVEGWYSYRLVELHRISRMWDFGRRRVDQHLDLQCRQVHRLETVIDQQDDTEFYAEPEAEKARWMTHYIHTTGGYPPEEKSRL